MIEVARMLKTDTIYWLKDKLYEIPKKYHHDEYSTSNFNLTEDEAIQEGYAKLRIVNSEFSCDFYKNKFQNKEELFDMVKNKLPDDVFSVLINVIDDGVDCCKAFNVSEILSIQDFIYNCQFDKNPISSYDFNGIEISNYIHSSLEDMRYKNYFRFLPTLNECLKPLQVMAKNCVNYGEWVSKYIQNVAVFPNDSIVIFIDVKEVIEIWKMDRISEKNEFITLFSNMIVNQMEYRWKTKLFKKSKKGRTR